jgi:hypothetical protein
LKFLGNSCAVALNVVMAKNKKIKYFMIMDFK